MDHLIFPRHALDEMRKDGLTEDDVYTVVGDFDERIEQMSGRKEYPRTLDNSRYVVVVLEDDDITVVSAWWNKRRSSRRRR